jgi:hypothetical protein
MKPVTFPDESRWKILIDRAAPGVKKMSRASALCTTGG